MGDKLNQQEDKGKQRSVKDNFFVFVHKFKIFSVLCTLACMVMVVFVFREVKAGKKNKSIFSPDGFFATASIKTNSPDEKTNGDNSDNSITVNPDEQTNTNPQKDTGDNQVANNTQSNSGNSSNSNNTSNSGNNGTSGTGGTTEATTAKPSGTTEATSKEPQPTQSIEVTGNLKSDYCVGQKIDEAGELSNLTVVATLTSGDKQKVSYGEYTIKTSGKSGFNTSTKGAKDLTITYGTSDAKASAKVSYGVEQWDVTLTLKEDKTFNRKIVPDENLVVTIKDTYYSAARKVLPDNGVYFKGWSKTTDGDIVTSFKMSRDNKHIVLQEASAYDSEKYKLKYVNGNQIAIIDYIINSDTVNIPDGIQYLYASQFSRNVSNYKHIIIPSSIIGGGESNCLCWQWDNLLSFEVASGNTVYSNDSQGILYNKSKTILYSCPRGKTGSIKIPSTVKDIGERAFLGVNSDLVVKVPNSKLENFKNNSELNKYIKEDNIVGY